jgi:hypothetical protein
MRVRGGRRGGGGKRNGEEGALGLAQAVEQVLMVWKEG